MKKITTLQKSPEVVRQGLKMAGIFSLLLAALLVFAGADMYSDVTIAVGGVAAANGTQTAVVAGEPMTTTEARELSVNLLNDSVSNKVTEMCPYKTPMNHIARKKGSGSHMVGAHGTGSYVHRYYQIDFRPILTTVSTDFTGASTLTAELTVANVNMFTIDDTLKPVIASPTSAQIEAMKGWNYSSGSAVQEGSLQLVVVGINYGQNKIIVQATNAKRATPTNELTAYVPSIPAGATLVRLGKAVGEIDAKTASWQDLPTDSYNYIQTFGAQFEITPEQNAQFKEVGWDLTQIKARTVREMLESQERQFLFGERSYFKDSVDQDYKYTMGGLWSAIQNVYGYTVATGFSKADYNSMTRQLFSNNSGEKERYAFIGSGFAEQLLNIDNEVTKYSQSSTPVVKFGMTFSGFTNVFGTVHTMLHPMLDLTGHANDAIIIDVSNIDLIRWGAMEVRELDLIKSGQKNVIAHFMKEKLTLAIRYPQTHMIVKGA